MNQTDQILTRINQTLTMLFAAPPGRADYPAKTPDPEDLSTACKARSQSYMRINHVGEVCAQALYQSQALTARDHTIRDKMRQSANEESDHLAWCERRLDELGGRKSLLNPLWYAGSFAIGTAAGIAGDKWSLGFVAETEQQVVAHLQSHLGKLPQEDIRSREIVQQMQQDESEHAQQAIDAGAAELPPVIKELMRRSAKFMTTVAYWV